MPTITDGTTTITPVTTVGYASSRPSLNLFHQVIGGGEDVTLRPAGLRKGTMTFLFESEDDAAAAETLHTAAAVLTYADTDLETVGMTYVVDGNAVRTLDPDTRLLWTLAVDYHEVGS